MSTIRNGERKPAVTRREFAKAQAAAGAVKEIITERELCQNLCISSGTAKNWRDSGKLPFIRLARSIRYHWPSCVQAMVRSQSGGAQ